MFSEMFVQRVVGGKPDASFPTTTNNNNLLYTNRNAYSYQSTTAHPAQEQHPVTAQEQENAFEICTKNDPLDGKVPVDPPPMVDCVRYVVGVQRHDVDGAAPEVAVPGSIDTTNITANSSCPSAVSNAHGEALPHADDDMDFGAGTARVLPVEVERTASDAGRRDKLTTNTARLEAAKFKLHRRPINDFLMFCKKHRPIVSQNFPLKENRYITKKLGMWWSHLAEELKHPYKDLADKHKAKYLAAFPNYRWGKTQQQQQQQQQQLTFEPERTDPSRPQASPNPAVHSSKDGDEDSTAPKEANGDRPAADTGDRTVDEQYAGSIEVAHCLVMMATGKAPSPMATFKLADETQMGSLNSLMAGGNANNSAIRTDVPSGTFEHNYSIVHNSSVKPTMHNGDCQESELQPQDLRTFAGNNREEPCANMRQHFLAQSRPKTLQHTGEVTSATYPRGASMFSPSIGGQQKDDPAPAQSVSYPTSTRATRSCKGKRYQEFMRQQQLVRNQNGGAVAAGRKPQHKRSSLASSTITTSSSETTVGALRNETTGNATITLSRTSPGTGIDDVLATGIGTQVPRVPDDEVVFAMYEELYAKIDELPCFEIEDFLAKQKGDKRRKKPYALSSKASKKRKSLPPKSSIPSPSCPEAITFTSSSATSPPTPPPVPATITTSSAETPAPPLPSVPDTIPPVTLPTATVPAKIVGCRKRKAPKEHIARHTML